MKILLKKHLAITLIVIMLIYIYTPLGKFHVLSGVYKDLFGVYYIAGYLIHIDMGYFGVSNGIPIIKRVKEADQSTFKSVDSFFTAKDKNSFYFFRNNYSSKGYEYYYYEVFNDLDTSKITKSGNYYYDDNHIVFAYSKLRELKNVDLGSWRYLGENKSIDSNYYYCGWKKYKLPSNFEISSCSMEFGSNGDKIYILSGPSYDSDGISNECFKEYPLKLDPKQFTACGGFGKLGNRLYGTLGDEYTPEQTDGFYYEFLTSYNNCMEKCTNSKD